MRLFFERLNWNEEIVAARLSNSSFRFERLDFINLNIEYWTKNKEVFVLQHSTFPGRYSKFFLVLTLYAHRDSNPKPSDPKSSRIVGFSLKIKGFYGTPYIVHTLKEFKNVLSKKQKIFFLPNHIFRQW